MVQESIKIQNYDSNLEIVQKLKSLSKDNELILLSFPLFFEHLKIEVKNEELHSLFQSEGSPFSLENIGINFKIESLLRFIKSKNEEEIKRFGGNIEEKDFEGIKKFLERCSGLKIFVERGQERFKSSNSKANFSFEMLINRLL
jgi:hypothetical protein